MSRRKRGSGLFWISAVIAGLALASTGGRAALTAVTSAGIPHGTLSCSQLEVLWDDAGGPSSAAFTGAEIARAESAGQQYATNYNTNGSVDYGYWQINTINGGSPADYIPIVNAREAVKLYKEDGWHPWVTWQKGLEAGQC